MKTATMEFRRRKTLWVSRLLRSRLGVSKRPEFFMCRENVDGHWQHQHNADCPAVLSGDFKTCPGHDEGFLYQLYRSENERDPMTPWLVGYHMDMILEARGLYVADWEDDLLTHDEKQQAEHGWDRETNGGNF